MGARHKVYEGNEKPDVLARMSAATPLIGPESFLGS